MLEQRNGHQDRFRRSRLGGHCQWTRGQLCGQGRVRWRADRDRRIEPGRRHGRPSDHHWSRRSRRGGRKWDGRYRRYPDRRHQRDVNERIRRIGGRRLGWFGHGWAKRHRRRHRRLDPHELHASPTMRCQRAAAQDRQSRTRLAAVRCVTNPCGSATPSCSCAGTLCKTVSPYAQCGSYSPTAGLLCAEPG